MVAERSLFDALRSSGANWWIQERQATVGGMWDALSGGRLDQRSRILVFSDSLMEGTASADFEFSQTAQAIAAMAGAGAHVFVATWRPEDAPRLHALVVEAAEEQGLDPAAVAYHEIHPREGARAVVSQMIETLSGEVTVPDVMAISDAPISREPGTTTSGGAEGTLPAPIVAGFLPPTLPPLQMGGDAPEQRSALEGLPEAASLELLSRPRLPGQVTITVTSAKGGSGKSTASIMLAATIARSSREAGTPLSVCLIDLDTRDGQVASLIGQFMPTALNIRVLPVWDEDRIRRNLVPAENLGIDTLLAPIRPRTADTVGADFYRAMVRSLQRMFDVVVMDTSVQYLDPLIANVALPEADEILFVTTLASTAVQGMARALREITTPVDESGLGIPREKIGIIVNQSVANVGMEREQILAAGLGVPVVGLIPLATKDVLTATNLNRMQLLLDHPLIGPAYVDLARACLPGRVLADWHGGDAGLAESLTELGEDGTIDPDLAGRRRSLFRR